MFVMIWIYSNVLYIPARICMINILIYKSTKYCESHLLGGGSIVYNVCTTCVKQIERDKYVPKKSNEQSI